VSLVRAGRYDLRRWDSRSSFLYLLFKSSTLHFSGAEVPHGDHPLNMDPVRTVTYHDMLIPRQGHFFGSVYVLIVST